MTLRTAVIPVAGLGTRFLPVTKTTPKELFPIVDRPAIEYIVEEVHQAGIKNIVLVNSRGKHAIDDYFDFQMDEDRFSHKQELIAPSHKMASELQFISIRQPKAQGLGHAILCARPVIQDEPFAVLLGEDIIDGKVPCIKQLMDVHEAHDGSPVVGVLEVPAEETNMYGIVGGKEVSPNLILMDTVVEKPNPADAPSRLAIPGRYILTPDIFDILENTKPSLGGEVQLTDALQELAKKRKFYAFTFEGQRFDAGSQLGFIAANIHFALKREGMREPMKKMISGFLK